MTLAQTHRADRQARRHCLGATRQPAGRTPGNRPVSTSIKRPQGL